MKPRTVAVKTRSRTPKLRRLYLLADRASGQVDPFAVYGSVKAAAEDGDNTEHVAVYEFVGYRARGKREPLPW